MLKVTDKTVYANKFFVRKGQEFFRFTDGAYDFTKAILTATHTDRITEALRMLEFAGDGAEIVQVDLVAKIYEVDPFDINMQIRAAALAKLTKKEREVLGV